MLRPALAVGTLVVACSLGAARPRNAHAAPPPPPAPAPLTAALPTSGAASDLRAEAISRFRRGVELYEEQDFNAALIEFRKAYELSPTYKVLYNVGQVCFQLQDYACALKSFENYLFEGSGEVPPDRRVEVDRELARLRARVGRLEIRANVDGADVAVDDTPIGHTPLSVPVIVSAGRRKVTVTARGRSAVTRMVDVPGATTQPVDVTLLELKGDVQLVERPSRMTPLSWIGVGSAGALGVAAAVTGVLALGASNDVKTIRFEGAVPNAAVTNKQSSARTLAGATDVLSVLAVGTLAVTLVLTFIRPAESPAGEEPKPLARLKPSFGGLEGAF